MAAVYHITLNFCEIAKNHINVNFRDKNFMITKFFRDYCHAVAPVQSSTIHIVVPPTILTRARSL